MIQTRIAAPAALLMALVGGSQSANAAVPAEAQAIFTTAATDFATLLGYGYVAMGVIVVGMIVLGLVKKVAKKSTSG